MEWHEMFPKELQPTPEDFAEFTGGAKGLWLALADYMDSAYKSKPKYTYSACGGKPGWNVKYAKSGAAFGTLYPERDGFSVFLVISYKLAPVMEEALADLRPELAELYRSAGDYMGLGKWMMWRIEDERGVDDYKRIMAVKLAVK